MSFFFFFFNDTATTEIYTLSLHDALPIYRRSRLDLHSERIVFVHHRCGALDVHGYGSGLRRLRIDNRDIPRRSEEHTSELQSLAYLVCRLLLEKKKKKYIDQKI